MQNYYEILELSPSAPTEEIKKAIHHQLRLWSQRTNAPQIERRQEAERMMRVLEEIETILLEPNRRAEYDRGLKMEIVKRKNDGTPVVKAQVTVSQQEIDKKLQEGWQLLEKGKIADALFLAIQLTDRVADHAEAWALLGRARFEYGEVDEAISPMVKACDLDSKNPKYIFFLGETFEKLGKFDRAEEQFKLALSLKPASTSYKHALGILYIKTKRVKEGLRLLEQCLREEPDNPDFQRDLARGYAEIACSSWKIISPGHPFLPAGKYPTVKVDMTMAKSYLDRARAIPFDDQELRTELDNIKMDIQKKKGRKFTGSWTAAIITFISLIAIAFFKSNSFNLFFIGLPFLYILSALTPKYRIYRKAIQGESSRTDFAHMFERLKDRFGVGAYIITTIFYILIAPISHLVLIFVVIYNFFRNYLLSGGAKV